MSIAIRVASEAAAWAVAGVYLALGSVYLFGRVSVPMGDFAVCAAAVGLVGGLTAFVAVAALVRGRLPHKKPVVGALRGAAIGVLVVVVVPSAIAFLGFGSSGVLYSLFGLVWWSVVVAGLPFAFAGAVLGRWMERRLFSSRGA